MSNQQNEHIISYWVRNLVGTPGGFSTNLLITVLGGSLYSFGILSSHVMLLFFGVVSPVLFTLCLYFYIRQVAESIKNEGFPKFFSSPRTSNLLMLADITIIVVLAVLIHLNYINYFFFRFLQTVLFPVLMLFMLRFLFISKQLGDRNE